MKKLICALLFISVLASCKKEYACNCTDATGTVTVENHKGKDATDACTDATSVINFKVCVPQ